MRKISLIVALTGFMSIAAPVLFAADRENQLWLTFEQGNAAFTSREYGMALQLYKDAIDQAGIFPEAEMAIGDVYLEEGEVALAIRHYNNAYKLRDSFYIPGSRYTVLYKLARLYMIQQSYGLMEQTLLLITADDKHFAETEIYKLKSQVNRNYLEKGLDKILTLYVFEDKFAASAHSLLGWYYYRTGRYTQAIDELLFALISRATEIISFLNENDPEYEFISLNDLLEKAMKNENTAAFVSQIDLFKDLYYLASTTFASGYPKTAALLWNIVSASTLAGIYQDLSTKQLKAPFIEPLLTATKTLQPGSNW